MIALAEELQTRIHGDASSPTLVYLPGLHGDWTLVSSFRGAVAGRVRFVELAYPRTVTWSLEDYAAAIESALLEHGVDRGWLLAESFGSQPAWQLIARFQERQRALMESDPTQTTTDGRTPLTPSLSPSDGERVAELSAVVRRAKAEGRVRGGGGSTDPPLQVVSGGFEPLGLILAGGFVRHPAIPGVRLMRHLNAALPAWGLRGLFRTTYSAPRRRPLPSSCLDG